MNNKKRNERIKIEVSAYVTMIVFSAIVVATTITLLNHLNNHENKFPILAAVLTTSTLIFMNLPEPLYYLIVKLIRNIDINKYKDEYTFGLMYLKLTGIAMSILCTYIYYLILS